MPNEAAARRFRKTLSKAMKLLLRVSQLQLDPVINIILQAPVIEKGCVETGANGGLKPAGVLLLDMLQCIFISGECCIAELARHGQQRISIIVNS